MTVVKNWIVSYSNSAYNRGIRQMRLTDTFSLKLTIRVHTVYVPCMSNQHSALLQRHVILAKCTPEMFTASLFFCKCFICTYWFHHQKKNEKKCKFEEIFAFWPPWKGNKVCLKHWHRLPNTIAIKGCFTRKFVSGTCSLYLIKWMRPVGAHHIHDCHWFGNSCLQKKNDLGE